MFLNKKRKKESGFSLMRYGKKQTEESKFSQTVRVLTAAVLTGLFTLSCADPWKENVPDFEVCFMEELPGTNAHAGNRNYLMWWTLLGVLPAEKDSFVPEKEATLTGRENAPEGGRYCHTLFQKEKDPSLSPGDIHFSQLFRKHPSFRKRGRFYGCISVKTSRTIKNAVLLARGNGDLKVWVNGMEQLNHPHGSPLTKVHNITLRSGYNRIVVRYTDPEKFDPDRRKFSLRFTGAGGNPMFVQ